MVFDKYFQYTLNSRALSEFTALRTRDIETYMQAAHKAILDPYDTLTTREREVLHLAAEGDTNGQMAKRLCITPYN